MHGPQNSHGKVADETATYYAYSCTYITTKRGMAEGEMGL